MKTILIVLGIICVYGLIYSIKECIDNHKNYINQINNDDG